MRKNRNFNKREPTRFIQIDSLPMTATSEDIRKLAREALPDGDKAIQECKWIINSSLFWWISVKKDDKWDRKGD